MVACSNEYHSIVEELLEAKADIHVCMDCVLRPKTVFHPSWRGTLFTGDEDSVHSCVSL